MHRVVTDLRPDARDTHIDGAVLAVVLDAAQGGEDFLTGENAPGVGGQQPEQIELGAGQLNALLAQPGFAHGAIDHQLTELQAPLTFQRHLGIAFAAPQQRANPRQQHARAHGLAHIVVSTHFQAEHFIHVVGARSQHQNRAVILPPHLAADGQAIFAGQHQIKHHQIRLFLENARHRLGPIGLDRHLQAVALQVLLGQLGQALVVLDDQDLPGFLLHTPSRKFSPAKPAGIVTTPPRQ